MKTLCKKILAPVLIGLFFVQPAFGIDQRIAVLDVEGQVGEIEAFGSGVTQSVRYNDPFKKTQAVKKRRIDQLLPESDSLRIQLKNGEAIEVSSGDLVIGNDGAPYIVTNTFAVGVLRLTKITSSKILGSSLLPLDNSILPDSTGYAVVNADFISEVEVNGCLQLCQGDFLKPVDIEQFRDGLASLPHSHQVQRIFSSGTILTSLVRGKARMLSFESSAAFHKTTERNVMPLFSSK